MHGGCSRLCRDCLCLLYGPCCQSGLFVRCNKGLFGGKRSGNRNCISRRHLSISFKCMHSGNARRTMRCGTHSTYKSRTSNSCGRRLCRSRLRFCLLSVGDYASPFQVLDQVNQLIPLPLGGFGCVQYGRNQCQVLVTHIIFALVTACHCR